jgi:hypothetical protein
VSAIRFYMFGGRSCIRPLLFLSAFVLLFEGCSLPKEPGTLWWNVDLVVPLGVRTYGIWDLADPESELRAEGSGIGMDADSNAWFSMWTDLEVSVADCLYFVPRQFDIVKPVTAIEVPVEFGMLNPDIAALHGTIQDIPAHELSASWTIPINSLIDSMTVDTGTAHLLVINSLPYSVHDLSVIVRDQGIDQTASTIEELLPNQQRTISSSLTGIRMSSSVEIKISATGDGGTQIAVDSTDRINLGLQIDTVTSAPYFGRLPEQQLYGDTAVSTEQPHIIDLATISAGFLNVRLENHTQVDDTLTLVLPDFTNQLSDSLVLTRWVRAGEEDSAEFSLAGFQIRLVSTDPQFLRGELYMHSRQTDDIRAFYTDQEYAFGHVSLSRLEFDFFSGELRDLVVPVDTVGRSIERPPDGWDVIHPTQVDAIVHIEEAFGGTADIALDVRTLYRGSTIGSVEFAATDVDMTTDSMFTATGLANLLVDYPDSAGTWGTTTLNGDVAFYTTSTIDLALEVQAPLAITMHSFHPPGDIEKIDTGDLNDVQSGSAEVTIYNRLPVGGRAFLVVSRDSLELLVNSGADVDTVVDVQIPVSEIVDGRATDIAVYETSLSLSDSVVSLFRNPPFYARTDVSVPGSTSDTLIVHGSDYLSVKILARLVYEIRTEDAE